MINPEKIGRQVVEDLLKEASPDVGPCFYTNRRDEGRQSFQELLKISREQPQFFTPDDLNKIQMNAQFFA